ncbi:MAG: molybdenum cofactor guanylyltransferase [Actinocrinis sp.]
MDFLILAGGEARRLDGADKPMVEVSGLAMLDRVIAACLGAPLARAEGVPAIEHAPDSCVTPVTPTVTVIGPERRTRMPVRWAREDPPGGGPVAAIAAGLRTCTGDLVGIFAADLPFLDARTVHSLWTALAEDTAHEAEQEHDGAYAFDGAVAVDADGRDQWLAAVYRRAVLASRIAGLGPDGARGLPLRRLVRDLRLLRVGVAGPSVLDCDTWEDVAAARRMARERARTRHIEGG